MASFSSSSCPCEAKATRVGAFASGVAATVAWYSLPDYVRSRPLRGLVKAGLLGVIGWSITATLPRAEDLPPYEDEDVDYSKKGPAVEQDPLEGVTEAGPAELAVLAGAAVGSAVLTVAIERWLFGRGERRRALGARFAHTRQGLVLGGLAAALDVAAVATLCAPAACERPTEDEGRFVSGRLQRPGGDSV